MPVLEIQAGEGRFKDAFWEVLEGYEGLLPTEGEVQIELFEEDGSPWLIHPVWAEDDPDKPGVLTAYAKDLFNEYRGRRGDILDRAADLRSRGYWANDHVEEESINFQGYAEWSKEQRKRLVKATVTFEVST